MAVTHTPIIHPVINPILPDAADIFEELQEILKSGRVTLGKHAQTLEDGVCALTGVKHAIAVSSGTSGLMLLIKALGLPKGSEVITPSFTFAATAHALLWNGLRPVFCDSEPGSFTMDARAAESMINERTSAIYPVCIFGVPGDIDAYQALADKYHLALIFDSAQGLGASYKGKAVGGFGDGEAFSMSPTKVVTALEGGLVTTDDAILAERVRHMRDYGKAPDGEDMHWLGLSARMQEVNALIACWSLARLGKWITNRAAATERYKMRLSLFPGVSFQHTPPHCVSSLNYFVVLLDPQISRITRDQLKERLAARGVQTKRYFYPALHNQTIYKHLEEGCSMRLQVAERVASQSLALPLYSHMTINEVNEICDLVVDCFNESGEIGAHV